MESMIKNLIITLFSRVAVSRRQDCAPALHGSGRSTLQQQLLHSSASEGFARCAVHCGVISWRMQAG